MSIQLYYLAESAGMAKSGSEYPTLLSTERIDPRWKSAVYEHAGYPTLLSEYTVLYPPNKVGNQVINLETVE